MLADEVTRATPKTKSAMLEAMQERAVTVAGETRPLPRPFMVMATQNPIEMEGTYPLPEAQLDRFMFNVVMDYLPEEDEVKVVQRTTAGRPAANANRLPRSGDVPSAASAGTRGIQTRGSSDTLHATSSPTTPAAARVRPGRQRASGQDRPMAASVRAVTKASGRIR